MKISIITVSYNSQDTIEKTIQSVLSQDYSSVEYLIIDGASSDKTLAIIDQYKNKITTLVSQKDKGIYDAINKGIEMATGDVIGLLHSDDFYPSENILSLVAEKMKDAAVDAVYGDLQYVDRNDPEKIFRHWRSGKYNDGDFKKGWMPPHPTFFARKKYFEKYGSYNLSFTSAADYELMLRFIHKHKIKLSYIPEVLVKMRIGGKSNASLMNRIRANREDKRAWKVNDLQPGFFTLLLKPLSKLKQFL